MYKRGSRRLPHDFHLWTQVAETVEPLRGRADFTLETVKRQA